MNKEKPPVKAGDSYMVTVMGLGHSGEGVGKYESFTIFIPGALPGEVVNAKIYEVKKNYAKGQLQNVVKPSEARTTPECAIYDQCGGCQLQHLHYTEQLTVKRQQVVDALSRIGKLAEVEVLPTLGAENPWYYRNKMQFPVGMSEGKIAVGCFAAGTHDIINTEHCRIQHEANNTIAKIVREIAAELKISAYDEISGKGILRHIMGRVGAATGEVMVVLVTTVEEFPQKNRLANEIAAKIPGLVSIVQNINPKKTNIILGDRTITLWGKDYIIDNIGDLQFRISARSFFQVNTKQTYQLYSKALEYADLSGNETIIDAYCGTGTITLFLARQAQKVYGIEIVKEAIADARQNAKQNDIANVEFIVGDAIKAIPDLAKQGITPDVIVVDPPRAGCERGILETFANMQPERIVYVSCNPASLARDLAVLTELGYQVRKVQPVDMFPMTHHVETVTLLQWKETAI